MKKVLVATIFTVTLLGLAIVPSAKADSFVYQVTSTTPAGNLDVTFDLPSFENPANNITTFVSGTLFGDPIADFGISGNSSECSIADAVGLLGPCWAGTNTAGATLVFFTTPSFSGTGTYISSAANGSTTVTITEVSGVPEPSGMLLLASGLLAVGLAGRKRRAINARTFVV